MGSHKNLIPKEICS